MAHKFVDWVLTILLWALVLAVVAGILWLFIQPVLVWTDKSEFRLYCRVALLLMAVGVFAILRLYNSIVQNTRFLVKLRTDVAKVLAEFPTLQRSINTLSQKNDSLRGTVSANTKAVTTLSEEAREILSALKHNGNLKNPS